MNRIYHKQSGAANAKSSEDQVNFLALSYDQISKVILRMLPSLVTRILAAVFRKR